MSRNRKSKDDFSSATASFMSIVFVPQVRNVSISESFDDVKYLGIGLLVSIVCLKE